MAPTVVAPIPKNVLRFTIADVITDLNRLYLFNYDAAKRQSGPDLRCRSLGKFVFTNFSAIGLNGVTDNVA